jgi:hypothetical protein
MPYLVYSTGGRCFDRNFASDSLLFSLNVSVRDSYGENFCEVYFFLLCFCTMVTCFGLYHSPT